MDGWIKLHRKLLKSACATDPEYLAVWIHILLMASHEEKEIIVNGSKMLIKPGSFVTSRLKMASQCHIQQSKLERILNYLKTEQQIEQLNLVSCRLISIVHWEQYQTNEQVNEQRMNSERTANEQRMNTIKNERTKELKKESVNTNTRDHHFSDDPLFNFEVFFEATRSIPTMQGWPRQKCLEIYEAMADWSATRSGNKRSDWLAVARTFAKRETGNGKYSHIDPARSSSDQTCICCKVPFVPGELGSFKMGCQCNPLLWCETHLKCRICCGCETVSIPPAGVTERSKLAVRKT